MRSTAILSTALLIVSSLASPLLSRDLRPRAGAPIAKPIPSNCSVTSPLDHCNATTRYRPTQHANDTLLYTYFLQPDSFQVTSSNASAIFTQCLDTCYGYGNTGDCKSAYIAYAYPMPPEFGLGGGNPVVACLMWNRTVTAADFEAVPASVSGYGNSTAGDISCPA